MLVDAAKVNQIQMQLLYLAFECGAQLNMVSFVSNCDVCGAVAVQAHQVQRRMSEKSVE